MERFYKILKHLGVFMIPFWITGLVNIFLVKILAYLFALLIFIGTVGTLVVMLIMGKFWQFVLCLGAFGTVAFIILEQSEILFIPVKWYFIFSGVVYAFIAAFWTFFKLEALWKDELNLDYAQADLHW